MRKRRLGDAIAGALAAVFVIASYKFPGKLPFLPEFEMKSYDARSLLRQAVDPNAQISIIAVDEDSLKQYGAWPWPRSVVADLLNRISPAKPKVIALDIPLSDPQPDAGLNAVKDLAAHYQTLAAKRKILDRRKLFDLYFSSAESRLDGDARLAQAVKSAGNVVLPLTLIPESGGDLKPAALPVSVSSDCLRAQTGDATPDLAASGDFSALSPLPEFAAAAAGVGRENPDFAPDGSVRRDFAVSRYLGAYIPSYGLAIALAAEEIEPSAATVIPGQGIRSKKFLIPLDHKNRLLITFNGRARTFHYDSFKDVMSGVVPAASFQGKIVFIGLTAPSAAVFYKTPIDPRLPAVEADANVAENILDRKFLTRPPWARALEWAFIGAAALLAVGVLPFLNAIWGSVLAVAGVLALAAAGIYWFIAGLWIKVSYPAALLVLGILAILLRRLLLSFGGHEPPADEMDKNVGLALREHGLLDAAFDKLRTCRPRPEVKAALRALAKDFEGKQEFDKAAAVLEHLGALEPKFRAEMSRRIADLKSRAAARERTLEEPTQLSAASPEKTSSLKALVLERYEIRRDLGRWEHGVIYRGWDCAAGRDVLLKTLDADAGGSEREKIKETLFRDATAAAGLEHPGIGRIFGAGEAGGIIYAALEILDGFYLRSCARPGSLLPFEKIMEHAAAAAHILDYAHERGIFHQSLSPETLIALKDGSLRIAGFGLAAFSSPLLGWAGVPEHAYYLSPELAAGRKADGRADIFSLGATLFELLTGEKPFKGQGDIGTLIFQIVNKPHPDPVSLNPSLPPEVKDIIGKALAKSPDERYARASLMADDLRACLARIGGAKTG